MLNLSLRFVLRIRESGSYENVAVLFQWCERMEDKQTGQKKRSKARRFKKKNTHFWS